jgi:hypothetical protein
MQLSSQEDLIEYFHRKSFKTFIINLYREDTNFDIRLWKIYESIAEPSGLYSQMQGSASDTNICESINTSAAEGILQHTSFALLQETIRKH